MSYTFESSLIQLDSAVYGHCVLIPSQISRELIATSGRRVVCHLNGVISYQCALMPLGDEVYFVNVTKSLHKQLGVKVGTLLSVTLEADTSSYGLPMPEELEELLHQDERGNEVFHALTPGKQRNLLYIIGQPKNSEIRLKKAFIIIDYLKKTGGRLDFKALNEALKGK